jgi:hypothetical protein
MSGEGCAYIVDDGDGRCGAACRAGSPYCPEHHALCHLAGGSGAARRRLREEAALAALVGGRSGRPGRLPPERFLKWLERAARVFAWPNRSRYVRKEAR